MSVAARSLACLGAGLLLVLAGSVLPAQASSSPADWVGRPLAEALRDLQQQGVNIIFSSDLVTDDMIVRQEPRNGSLDHLLDRLLGPHGLEAEIGPRGTVLVVRRGADPILVWITQPEPGDSLFGEVTIAAEITSREDVKRVDFLINGQVVASRETPPYRVQVALADDNTDREFTVVAHGAWGGTGASSVSIEKIEIDESVEVALKQLYVTVERDDTRLLDLGRESFAIFDKGERRQLVTFEGGDVPISAVLLLDSSESMRGAPLAAALDGTRSFLARMNALDQSMVILFSDRTLGATRFSNNQKELLAGLSDTVADGGTALNDYLYTALRLLDHVSGRRVVILLSDGADVLSTLRMRDVLWKVRRSDALIYWIRHLESHQGTFSSSWRDFEANEKEGEGLERAIEESGGRILTIAGIEQVESAFDEIMSELRDQYVLGYYPVDRRRDGRWRPVRVVVNAPLAKVRFRAGYVDY